MTKKEARLLQISTELLTLAGLIRDAEQEPVDQVFLLELREKKLALLEEEEQLNHAG